MEFFGKLARNLRAFTARHGYACDSCGAELFDYPKSRFCTACQKELHNNDQITCPKCGRMTVSNGVCLNCKSHAPRFDKGFSPFVYDGQVASLVNRFKNGGRRLAYAFADCMATEFVQKSSECFLNEPLYLLPVPSTAEKRLERGFNPAEDLALALLPLLTKNGISVQLADTVLQKTRDTAEQKHLGHTLRAENVKGAYHVHKRKFCQGKTLLVVDDIMTTGSTGDECARLLKSAGAKAVYFLVIASLSEL